MTCKFLVSEEKVQDEKKVAGRTERNMTVYCTYHAFQNWPQDGVCGELYLQSSLHSSDEWPRARNCTLALAVRRSWVPVYSRGWRWRGSCSRLGINERRCKPTSSPPVEQQLSQPPDQTVQRWHDVWSWPWSSFSPQSIKGFISVRDESIELPNKS